jgi:SulP family sulfate permease
MLSAKQLKDGARRYSWNAFGGDICGGLIASLVAFPYGLAMATAMGLPPVLGVFTSILTAPVTALLGRNAVMIGGTSSVTIPFIAVAVRSQGIGGAAKVSIVAAVLMLIFSFLRLGQYVAWVPKTVMAGFSCGIGGMMVTTQLPVILALAGRHNTTWDTIVASGAALLHPSGLPLSAIVCALIVMAVASITARISNKSPALLVGIVVSVGILALLRWQPKEIGYLSSSLPPFVGFSWMPSDVYTVLPAAFGLAFVTSVNLLVTSRVVEHFRGRHTAMKKSDADRELGAYGIANMVSGVFAAPMSVGIPARSLANVQCGGTTRMSNLFHAGFLLLFLTAGATLIAHTPLAALAGATAWMGLRLMEWSTWKRLPKMRTTDALGFLTTALLTIFSNAVLAVTVGCSFYVLGHYYPKVQSWWQSLAVPATPAGHTAD